MIGPGPPDDDEEVLLASFGRAMSTWSELEASLAGLFQMIVGASMQGIDVRPAMFAFFAVQSFEVRLTMVNAAAQQKWQRITGPASQEGNAEHLKDWNRIFKDCEKARRKRGKIGHLSAARIRLKDGRWAMRLVRPGTHPENHGFSQGSKTRYSAGDLLQLAHEWHALSYAIHQFELHVVAQELSSKSPPPAGGQGRPPQS
jgi:hypothetical protein